MLTARLPCLFLAFVLPTAAFAASDPWPHEDTITCNHDFPNQVQVLVPAGSYDYIVDDDDGPDADFVSIQDALDASGDGDTLYVCPGHYAEQIRVEHEVVLASLTGADDTIIDSAGGGTVATLNASTTLRGFTLTGSTYTSVCFYGGGIKIGGQAGLLSAEYFIENNRIVDNEACKVGGIYVAGFSNGTSTTLTTTHIKNNLIARNYAAVYNAGGISIHRGFAADAEVVNNVIASNYGVRGTGIEAVGTTSYSFSYELGNNIIFDNSGAAIGGTTAAFVASYNDVYGNASNLVSGTGNISVDPLFVDEVEYHLDSSSPCRNVGNPGTAFKDVDGSRNDIGAYGGPLGGW